MEINLVKYYFILILSFLVISFIAKSIRFSCKSNNESNFSLQLLISLVLIISSISIFYTSFKTINIVYVIIIGYMFFRKTLKLSNEFKIEFKKELIAVFFLSIFFVIQYLLIFNNGELGYPSDDIVFYGKVAQDLIQFKQENISGVLNEIYPELFKGTKNYHYFELWITGYIASTFNLSYGYTLYFIVYPILLFIYSSLLFSLIKTFISKSSLYIGVITFALLFIGPVYLNYYSNLFNDGNMIGTTIFTIPGFNLNSLPFSYYGQKHLTTYIFLIASIILYFHKHYKLFIIFAVFSTIASFGVFIGVFGGLFTFTVLQKKHRSIHNIILLIISSLTIIAFYQLTNQPIMRTVTASTLYLDDFGKHLNIKGEIARGLGKVFIPFIWYSILFIPFLTPLFFEKKIRSTLYNNSNKSFIFFVILSFLSASAFTIFVQGLNSDQFLTNLLPLFNLSLILLVIFYIKQYNSFRFKAILLLPLVSVLINISFTLNRHYYTPLESFHSKEFIDKVNQEVALDNKIGYFLSNETITNYPPINWYPFKPGKYFILTSGFNRFINLNYPYTFYKKSSSSIAYSPENQLKFFIGDSVSIANFEPYQKEFILKHNLNCFFASDIESIPSWFENFNHEKTIDSKSGICFIKLTLVSQ